MPSDIGQKLIGILSPSVGDFLAKAKVTAACKLNGTDVEKVSRADLAPVANHLELICKSLGPEVAKNIKERALAL